MRLLLLCYIAYLRSFKIVQIPSMYKRVLLIELRPNEESKICIWVFSRCLWLVIVSCGVARNSMIWI